MTELVKAPDVAAQAIAHLNSALTPPVSSRIPNPRPTRFVRVTQVPWVGFVGKVLFHTRLVVEAYGTSEPDAFDLAADAEKFLKVGPWEVTTDGVGQYPADPVTDLPKAGFTAEIYTRGAVSTI